LRRAAAIPLMVVASACAASAPARAAERHAVSRPVASIRNAPGSFAIGHVFAGARVDVIARRGRWVYAAWAPGRCGWLMDRGLEPLATVASPACPADDALAPRALFAPGSYQLGCGEGCVFPARVVRCADRTVFANYAAGVFADPIGRERVSRGTRGPTVPRYAGVRSGYSGFGVRYVTRDGIAALIKDSRAPKPVWRFIRAECVERLTLLVRPVPRLRAAIRAFGRVFVRSGCVLHWPRLVVTARFDRCRRLDRALITPQRIRGSALVHTWATREGLRLGDPVARLQRLYPGARRFRGTYRVAPGVRAVIRGDRVGAFRVTRSARRPPR
jgi:hypothetical protein